MSRTSAIAAFVATAAATASPAWGQLAPWAGKALPTDVPRQHVEEVRDGRHVYKVIHGGTMDGENCRSPMGCGMAREGAIEQVWQSNRLLRMENVGGSDVVNPWISNGRNNFRNIDEIVAVANDPKLSAREKALLLWFQQIQHRFHRSGNGDDQGDPVKVFNVYGHNPCGSDAIMMGGLWRRVGVKGAPARLVGHSISQAYFDGRWNLLDGDLDQFFLLRDNVTIASDRDLARDHDLVKRAHTLGILLNDSRGMDENEAAMFVCESEITGERRCREDSTMNMTLRPGEAVTWRWGHLTPAKYMWKGGPDYPDTVCNGLWEYAPTLTGEAWKRGAETVENIISSEAGIRAEQGKTGSIVWIVRSPYAMVGGQLVAEGAGAQFAASADGKTWTDIAAGNFDSFFSLDGKGCYEYRLRCTLSGEATLSTMRITNDLQMALLAMPELRVGENTLTYTDASAAGRQVRITHEWVERSTSRPPDAPAAAVYPSDGGVAEGTEFAFQWQAPANSGGGAIADYQFELSDRPDLKYPMSTNFYKLISRTKDKGRAQYTLPYAGLLSPERTYYWHVRAKNADGVWGPWSRTWSFVVHAVAEPVELAVDGEILRWKANPAGNRPAKYRVYASDERGFSVSDAAYAVNVGISKELPKEFAANFVAETEGTELAVMGAGRTNRTYYRVVAVDGQGNRSGPSDYAEAPRPLIYSEPVVTAKVGQEYRYPVQATRSLGDLRFRQINGREVANFWDVEHPAFAIVQDPGWLKIDPQTGVLSGTPDAAGTAEVVITATIDREVRQLDENALGWGIEKVIATTAQRVGQATQRFRIDVRP